MRYLQESGFTKCRSARRGHRALRPARRQDAANGDRSDVSPRASEYVENFTRDLSLEAGVEVHDRFLSRGRRGPRSVEVRGKLLHKRGLRNRKLLILDRWVDVDRFHPKHRAQFLGRLGVANSDQTVKFLYVGRIGVEKNLDRRRA
jgi:glycosyltransferase involved in cell wall biosynthesis